MTLARFNSHEITCYSLSDWSSVRLESADATQNLKQLWPGVTMPIGSGTCLKFNSIYIRVRLGGSFVHSRQTGFAYKGLLVCRLASQGF
tara:strand:- start:2537 stop:2803 length:267 start_codon:yes stop_codon:yes gene_type:complete